MYLAIEPHEWEQHPYSVRGSCLPCSPSAHRPSPRNLPGSSKADVTLRLSA